jgi:hypothetical protein
MAKKKTRPRVATIFSAAAGVLAAGVFTKKQVQEDAFRRAVVKGIRSVAGTGIVRDPYAEKENEACLAEST